ncbi:MAG: hypothetical protein K2M08_03845 [Anaeroplasmataceae bacterium]|nr:hypothetical protein [Anaeroplasmataceae bacterium]
MNVEGYVLKYIEEIEKQRYDAYLVGTTVLQHILGRPIEEYDMITSAPLFSLSKKQKEEENIVHIQEHKKRIRIFFLTSKETYYKECCYKVDTLLYHPKHGIIDEKQGLDDIERKRISVLDYNNLKGKPIFLLEALFYHVKFGFHFEQKLANYLANFHGDFHSTKKIEIGKYLTAFLTLETPGKLFWKYKNIFSKFFPINDFQMKCLDYTKNTLILRLVLLWKNQDIILAEKFLREYGFSKEVRVRILQLLDCQEYLFTEETLKNFLNFQKEDIGILFSIKRAEHCALNQIAEIPFLDALEKKCYILLEKQQALMFRDLEIKAADLEQLGYQAHQIPKVLEYLLMLVKNNQIQNSYEDLIKVASINQVKNYF